MGKATKKERQKANRAQRQEELAKKESRARLARSIKGILLVLIVPVVVIASIIINKATDPDIYTAKILVSIDGVEKMPGGGIIEVKLDDAFSPDSVKHFTGFASNGVYDGDIWHRVVKDFVIQTGDPKGDGSGSHGTSIVAELPRKGYKPGDLVWAKGANDPNGTAGSQFFIVTGKSGSQGIKALNTKTADSTDGKNKYQYGFIGHVTKGLNIARMIEALADPKATESDPASQKPTKKVIIVRIVVFKNGKAIKQGDVVAPTTTAATTTTAAGSSTTTTTTAP